MAIDARDLRLIEAAFREGYHRALLNLSLEEGGESLDPLVVQELADRDWHDVSEELKKEEEER